ncbi:protein eva-1 homolog C-like isoform X3 [Kogia breviceps]|uniref:protein eva-1 homolog C-like isoform X3 n=1 Tax=Kogia breviceps TaxID=27615 RepID=UPI0034D231CB
MCKLASAEARRGLAAGGVGKSGARRPGFGEQTNVAGARPGWATPVLVPSGYLKKVLKNHTAHACEGEKLGITCPQKTSISILSAFYGRKVPDENFCPTLTGKTSENATCVSVTARQKLLDECKDQRWCQISVNSQMFGQDPCPGTYKYLVVSYKCRPVNYRIKTVCENGTLRLRCRNKSVLTIFSANYGKFMEGKQECDVMNKNGPVIECLAPDALQRVSRQCQKRESCTLFADTATFGEPCFPGVKKQLQVSYICVPVKLLQQMDHSSLDPFTLSDYIYGQETEAQGEKVASPNSPG